MRSARPEDSMSLIASKSSGWRFGLILTTTRMLLSAAIFKEPLGIREHRVIRSYDLAAFHDFGCSLLVELRASTGQQREIGTLNLRSPQVLTHLSHHGLCHIIRRKGEVGGKVDHFAKDRNLHIATHCILKRR